MNKLLVISALSASMLVGCGGSGSETEVVGASYKGSTSAAVISSTTQSQLTAASIEAITYSKIQRENIEFLPIYMPTSEERADSIKWFSQSRTLSNRTTLQLANSSTGVSFTDSNVDGCGGSIDVSGSETSISITYNDFCNDGYGQGVTFNGTQIFTITDTQTTIKFNAFNMSSTDFDILLSGEIVIFEDETREEYSIDLAVVLNGNSYNLSSAEVCENGECVSTINIEGTNGIVYQLEDLESYSASSYTYVNGKVFEPEVGYVLLDAEYIEFCEEQDNSIELSAGTIILEDESNNQLEITVTACGEYDVNIIENNVFEAQQI